MLNISRYKIFTKSRIIPIENGHYLRNNPAMCRKWANRRLLLKTEREKLAGIALPDNNRSLCLEIPRQNIAWCLQTQPVIASVSIQGFRWNAAIMEST